MTKQVLNQVKCFFKELNEHNNEVLGDEYAYRMQEPNQYKRGRYSVIVEYKIICSPDFNRIAKFVSDNNLLIIFSTYREGQAYMSIQ